MGVLPSCLSVHYMLAGCLPCQKRPSDTLSQLQVVASHHVGGAGSQIWLSSRCFHPMSHLSRPSPWVLRPAWAVQWDKHKNLLFFSEMQRSELGSRPYLHLARGAPYLWAEGWWEGKSTCCSRGGPTWWFTTVCNSNPRGPYVLFWPPRAPGTHTVQNQRDRHTHKHTPS